MERLRDHFIESLNLQDCRLGSAEASDFPYDIEEYLQVPLAEVLQYPYLLFNNELAALFTSCISLLIDQQKIGELEPHHPGIYMLVFHPSLKVSFDL